MDPDNIDPMIEALIIEGKKRNRLPQHLALSQGTRDRLTNAILNCIETNQSDDFIEGYIMGFLLGYGHLFHDVSLMLQTGMITDNRGEGGIFG